MTEWLKSKHRTEGRSVVSGVLLLNIYIIFRTNYNDFIRSDSMSSSQLYLELSTGLTEGREENIQLYIFLYSCSHIPSLRSLMSTVVYYYIFIYIIINNL